MEKTKRTFWPIQYLLYVSKLTKRLQREMDKYLFSRTAYVSGKEVKISCKMIRINTEVW